MKLALIGGLILLVISTMSLAQIRYALFNPLTSATTIMGLIIEIGAIAYIAYRFLSNGQKGLASYSMVGVKGGRARRTSNLNHHRKHKRTSF